MHIHYLIDFSEIKDFLVKTSVLSTMVPINKTMSRMKVRLITKASKIIRTPLQASKLSRKTINNRLVTAEQARNRRQLGEYGAKLIREHKDEFLDLDDL